MKKTFVILSMMLSIAGFGQKHKARTFVFVPGAWDGGWDYAKVDSILSAF